MLPYYCPILSNTFTSCTEQSHKSCSNLIQSAVCLSACDIVVNAGVVVDFTGPGLAESIMLGQQNNRETYCSQTEMF